MEGLTEGRIVHYVLQNGMHRPAIVTHVWRVNGVPPENGCSNLTVFMDQHEGDGGFEPLPFPLIRAKTSVLYDENASSGTWHWIEKA